MQLRKEIEVGLTDGNSGDSIGVPIKKRFFRSLQCPSSPAEETCLLPQSCRGQPKKFLLEADTHVPEHGAGLSLMSSSMLSGHRSYLCGDLNTSLLHGSAIQANHEEMELKKATSTFEGSNVLEDLNVDSRLSIGSDMEKGQQLSQPSKSEMLVGDRIMKGKFASSDVSALQGAATTLSWHLSSSKDKECHSLNSKQENTKTCSLDLPLANGLQYLHQTTYGSVHPCVNRENWDLNVPMDAWDATSCDATSCDAVVEHGVDDRLKQGSMHMHEQKVDRHLVHTTLVTIGSDLGPGTSTVEGSQYNLRSRNWGMPADDNRGYEGGLELQLRPPSIPELHINWGKNTPPDLSLSLTGSLLDASCRVVKPEPCECSSQKETETSQRSSLSSVGIRHVKSEPCDGNFQGEASKVAVPLPGRVVKPESPKELEGKSPNLELNNHQSTSCWTESPSGKVKPVFLKPDANKLPDDSLVMPGNAKIKSGESTCLALDSTTVSCPNIISCNAEDVLSEICTHQHAEGSTNKLLDIVGSVISDSKGCNAKETELLEIADMAPTLPSESVSSDPKEPMASDGLSEGSAEMDCSDGECYTSSELVAGDVHMEPDKNSVPSGGNQEGINLPTEIQKEQLNGNEQQSDAPPGLNGARDEIVDGEDGKLGDPVPQCANEGSCEHEEKGVHGNVSTDYIGLDGVPITMEVHLDTMDKQTVVEEAKSGHSAENFDGNSCHGKKERSCNMTMDLHESSATRVLGASSSKRLIRTSQGETVSHLRKKEPPCAIAKTSKDYVGSWPMNIRDASVLTKHPELPQRDSDGSVIANKHVDDRGKHSQIKNVDDRCKHRQVTKVNSLTVRSFGQSSSISARSDPLGSERERLIDNLRGRDRLYPQGRRNSKFESKKNQDQQLGKCDSDYMNSRRDGNRDYDRDSDTYHAPELNNGRGYRFPRLSRGLEVPFDVAPNGSVGSTGRLLRRPIDDQLHSSHFPPRRPWPGPREGPMLLGARSAGHPPRDIGPDREVHANLLLAHDGEIVRSLPGELVDNLFYSHPSLQYESAENDLLPRGRSLSPIQRRVPPVQFYRARSPCKWPSTGRSPDIVIDKHPELIRHGPPVVRIDRLRSPHSRLSFPEEVMFRRNVSPPFSELPSDVREMYPVEDFDLPRPAGVVQRNMRRFDLGPHETAEYPGPSHFADQFVDGRDYRGRRELIQPLRSRLIPGNDEEDIPCYPADDDCYRPINFCPDGEVFPGRGSSRDFDGHVSTRPRNIANRLRSLGEQREDYRHHGKQGWHHDGGLNDVRPKRRKF